MPKLRHIVFLLLFAGLFWHFYGDSFQRDGLQGVASSVESDVVNMLQNPTVNETIQYLNNEIEQIYSRLTGNEPAEDQPEVAEVEQPELGEPTEQSFSIHNVEIGDKRAEVEDKAGSAERATFNEYGTEWVTYHENYQNFFMAAYDEEDKVAGLYTNQDLLASKQGINYGSSSDTVLAELDTPITTIRKGLTNYEIESNGEYNTFELDNNYVTIFFDLHENDTVTAIQIISKNLEEEKEGFFGEPREELKKGFEYQLFDITNAARVARDLPPLEWHEPVKETARSHSNDMADNNYFSHTNLDGESPFDRIEADAISFQMAGENLAAGQTSSIFAHEGLMNSAGHRENILKSEYQELGVGVAFNEDAQPFYTEKFLTE
ncbi:CAP-associated domain-containing protein [Virgibacillus oceani]